MRVLKYSHKYMTEHPELRKGRRHLFVSSKDNNEGKELSAAPHSSENIPGKVKAQEVRAVATSLYFSRR